MTGRNKIRAVAPDAAETAETLDLAASDEAYELQSEEDWSEDDAPVAMRRQWVLPALGMIVALGWTGFFSWAYRAQLLAVPAPQQGIQLLVQWAVPMVLIVGLWLLLVRNSTREATRFGEVALTLREESRLLEERLLTANRELSLAREFLAAQSRELESVGRIAGERLSIQAGNLAALVQGNRDHIAEIAEVSTTALDNMGRLRDDLPVIANSSRDVANQIGAAGRMAHGQVAELIGGFERLNQFGQASERQVGALQTRVDAALAAFEAQFAQMGDITGARFDALRSASEQFRSELDGREVEALAGLRRRAETLEQEIAATRASLEDNEKEALKSLRARLGSFQSEAQQVSSAVRSLEDQAASVWQGQVTALEEQLRTVIEDISRIDAQALESANRKLETLRAEAELVDRNIAERDATLIARIEQRQMALARTESETLKAFEARLTTLDTSLAERRQTMVEQIDAMERQGAALTQRLDELHGNMRAIAETGENAEGRLAASVAALSEQLGESRAALAGTDQAVAELTDASVRLLELIQASAQHSRTELPLALTEAETRLATLTAETDGLSGKVSEAARQAEDLSAYVITARDEASATIDQLASSQTALEQHAQANLAQVAQLSSALASTGSESAALAEQAKGALSDSIALLEHNARGAIGAIDTASAEAIRGLAERLARQSSEAIEAALADGASTALSGLEQAAARATGASREATVQLRDQLARVNELASNLESRVARARDLAEQQVDRDFARRVALISEGLNSTAIDIAKVLSTDVSDSAWTSYLRGDRGIFTRRAVRLLDNTEAREIAELYDADPDFRENVSRYIADFENMLRTLLSTRDGKAVSVTLLSSDMGKLYVALAQAIERLRA